MDLAKKYPGASEDSIDFLNRALVFNPYYRLDLQSCLEHPLFAKVRKPQNENIKGQPVELDFEKDNLNREKLRELILKEISHYQR